MGFFNDLRKHLRDGDPMPSTKPKVDPNTCTFSRPNMQARYHEPEEVGRDVDVTGEKVILYKCFNCGVEWSAYED